MCAIVGSLQYRFSKKTNILQPGVVVNQILNNQGYRGPDSSNLTSFETHQYQVYLGHNRLRIIDLQPESDQPMCDDSRRYYLVYNGMLYNYLELKKLLQEKGHLFKTKSDTEVVLHSFLEWGERAFEQFNGMFAIAIYDSLEEKLYLARDRFGVKPLFFSICNDQFYFASTSAELATQLRLQPNMRELARGWQFWCYSNEATVYEGISQIKPGQIATVIYQNNWEVACHPYYALKDNITEQPVGNFLEEGEALLQDAVRIRLLSDVDVGLSLSGGLDSALIAGLVKHQQHNTQAFTYGDLKHKNSEASLAKLTADRLGLNLNYVTADQKSMQESFWQTLMLQDAPFPNFSIVGQYLVFKTAKEQGIKVMLGGQGSDEIFMGYRKYFFFYLKHLLATKKYLASSALVCSLSTVIFSEFLRLKHYFYNRHRYSSQTQFPKHWQRYQLPTYLGANPLQPLWMRQHEDIYKLSLPALLRYEDRNSMGNSIESRLPFLDYRLVEYALRLPENMKLRGGYNKWLLRKIAMPYVDNKICFSKVKRGFDVNNKKWLTNGLGQQMREVISGNEGLVRHMGLADPVSCYFSDNALENPMRLAECITLTWLASKSHFRW